MVWCFVGLRSVLCAGQSISSTPNLLIDVFIDLALCSGVQSYWNEKSPSPNSSHKVGDMKLSKILWYGEILRVTFTGTKGPSLNPEEQPHTIIPPPPNLTHKQWSQTHIIVLALPNTDLSIRLPDGKCDLHLHCSRGKWWGALRHCIQRFPLHLAM